MPSFSFNLEGVLRYRARREEDAVLNQARADSAYRKSLHALTKTKNFLEKAMAGEKNGLLDLEERMLDVMYRGYLQDVMKRQTAEVADAQNKLTLCRERTVSAHRERLVLEKLKEKKYGHYLSEENAREQKETDEISLHLQRRKEFGR